MNDQRKVVSTRGVGRGPCVPVATRRQVRGPTRPSTGGPPEPPTEVVTVGDPLPHCVPIQCINTRDPPSPRGGGGVGPCPVLSVLTPSYPWEPGNRS